MTIIDFSKHKVVLVEILKDIYNDPELRTALGFKGGSAAMLFYSLPRFSVDLDFDLLRPERKAEIMARLPGIISNYGTLREATEKRNTLFFLLSYSHGERVVKVEISKRVGISRYEQKSYLGISMLVVVPADMLAGKLSALLTRKKLAMRDVYDLWFFLKNMWVINEAVVLEKTGLPLQKSLDDAIKKVSLITKNQVLQGIGDLIDSKQKSWVKEKLIAETLFYLRLTRQNLSSVSS